MYHKNKCIIAYFPVQYQEELSLIKYKWEMT